MSSSATHTQQRTRVNVASIFFWRGRGGEGERRVTMSQPPASPWDEEEETASHADEAKEQEDAFSSLREQCDALVGGEKMDKEVALGVMRLFHQAETATLALRHAKEKEAAKLRHELELMQRTHRQAGMLDALATDVASLKVSQRDVEAQVQAVMASRRR